MASDYAAQNRNVAIRNVTAVLGPTNTGKTHLAIERMLGHDTGMIGLPLRLLAREVYDRIVPRVGADKVALITGEEKIKPDTAQYWVCTVEAMPQDVTVDFLAIDEIQLAGDLERGHVFTDRLLHARGEMETLVLGASTMRPAISDLIPGANFITRPRLSRLSYAGQKKITRLPPRSAIVAFSAAEVYAIAELIRRQRGGAAVVLGALSPRTRNAQVALYQSGDVDYMVATDAIGMGLNLDVDHVSFSSLRKFDGQKFRNLTAAELGQIAGRAGRHMNDGTFGVTGDAEPLEQELVERLEEHEFDPIKTLQWRARELDFSSVDALRDSLRVLPGQRGLAGEHRLTRVRSGEDLDALETATRDADVVRLANGADRVEVLWEACQIPDYRKISLQAHAELVGRVFKDVAEHGHVDEDWFARQVAFSDRTDGDIDTLSNRLAHIRTWTFVANRQDWLKDPGHWQGRTREIEDNLSDALHACLTQRFVDARASALMRGMKDNQELPAKIGEDGSIHVASHYVGSVKGFRYIPDAEADGLQGKTTRNAAGQVLAREMSMRARRVVAAKNDAFTLARDGAINWRGDQIAKLDASDDPLKPTVSLLADDSLQGADRERVLQRIQRWVTDTIAERLKPLVDIAKAEDIDGLARGIAFQLTESCGVLKRESVANDLKALDQPARAQLRRYGVRFGAFNIFFPVLLKPAAADILLTLWSLRYSADNGLDPASPPEAPRAGLTSAPADPAIPEAFYRAYGFHVCGPRVVRIDMLERLADLIRPLLGWRPKNAGDTPPNGATGDGAFTVIPEMMSILGCSPGELGHVLRALGFRSEDRQVAPARETAPVNAGSGNGEASGVSVAADASPDRAETPADADVAAVVPQEMTAEAPSTVSLDAESDAVSGLPASATEDHAGGEVAVEAGAEDVAGVTADVDENGLTAGATPAPPVLVAEKDGEPVAAGTDVEASAPAPADAEDAPVAAELLTIEIWRPKRRHEGGRHRRERQRGARDGARKVDQTQGEGGDAASTQAGDRAKGDGRGQKGVGRSGAKGGAQRFDKSKGRRNPQRRGLTVHTSSPKASSPRERAADPDSPFAALSALKESLNKTPSEKSDS